MRIIFLLLVLFASCAAPSGYQANFPERPGASRDGNLCGPFTGRVAEAASGNPVSGAFVQVVWSQLAPQGASPIEAGNHSKTTATELDGRYKIDAAPCGKNTANVHMLIYKRGYLAYRSDRRFSDFGPRNDFAQHDHIAFMERWSDRYSHARHLRFVGSDPAVVALTEWEVPLAVAELEKNPSAFASSLPQVGFSTYWVATQLLTEVLIRQTTQYEGAFESGPLDDEPDTSEYSSQHFRAADKPGTYDIALRLWRMKSNDDASQRYLEIFDKTPTKEERADLGDGSENSPDRGFVAKDGQVYGVAFLDHDKNLVGLLTCGEGLCKSNEMILTIARAITQKIHRGAGK